MSNKIQHYWINDPYCVCVVQNLNDDINKEPRSTLYHAEAGRPKDIDHQDATNVGEETVLDGSKIVDILDSSAGTASVVLMDKELVKLKRPERGYKRGKWKRSPYTTPSTNKKAKFLSFDPTQPVDKRALKEMKQWLAIGEGHRDLMIYDALKEFFKTLISRHSWLDDAVIIPFSIFKLYLY